MQKNEQQILLPGFLPLSYSQNGEQAIAGSGTNAADAYWLIDLIEGSREKLPAWGGGALCFAGNRLFSVNVVTVRQEEVIIKNDQFYAVPLP